MNYATSLVADPAGSNAIVAAIAWLQGTLLGTIATTVAIVGVATIGFTMLTGRIAVRRGATIICGCFILLGAGSIAAGLRALADGLGESPAMASAAPTGPAPAVQVTIPVQHDPYAGAAVFR